MSMTALQLHPVRESVHVMTLAGDWFISYGEKTQINSISKMYCRNSRKLQQVVFTSNVFIMEHVQYRQSEFVFRLKHVREIIAETSCVAASNGNANDLFTKSTLRPTRECHSTSKPNV